MATQILVLYPADASFKLDYYLANHMPMVLDKFKAHGMTGWKVAKLVAAADGSPSPYSIQATLDFTSQEGFKAALAAESEAVLGDIPNFSDKGPIIVSGDVVGSS